MGSWFDHVSEYSAARNQLNIHFVQYENLLKVGDILLSIAQLIVNKSAFLKVYKSPYHERVCQKDFDRFIALECFLQNLDLGHSVL